ncbi:MAG: DUF4339 domain-containing protein [Muribaculaceae bacterium]|nr:DUF4339 domain-containing protein [Muribaculaceae bacterium]
MDNNSFFSVDRLVEFGLGVSVARQMIDMTNRNIQNMYIPGSIDSMPKPEANIYVAIDSKPVGPLSNAQFGEMVTLNKVNKDTLAWRPGMTGWRPIGEIPELVMLVAMLPPAIPQQN